MVESLVICTLKEFGNAASFGIFYDLDVFFGSTTIFLAKEMLKKLGFVDDFANQSDNLVTWDYPGNSNHEPGQRNIVLRGKSPFVVLVGFKLNIPLLGFEGMDVFGYVSSDDQGVAVISLYQGRGPCEFMFILDTSTSENPITITSTDADQNLSPSVNYPPHIWQKWGIYG